MNSKLRNKIPDLDRLFEAVLKLENIDECYDFFDDLCTVSELKDMAQRICVAGMLREKRHYNDIVAKTGASTATISRVKRTLDIGCDGYKIVFDRMENNE